MWESYGRDTLGEDGASIDLHHIAAILQRVHQEAIMQGPLLVCLVTGEGSDGCFEPMPRSPMPPLGSRLNDEFAEHFLSSLKLNPAVHDGAVLFRRPKVSAHYSLAGWSYRLMAPLPPDTDSATNKGSAYNSCLATSARAGVDSVFLCSRGRTFIFYQGREIALVEPSLKPKLSGSD